MKRNTIVAGLLALGSALGVGGGARAEEAVVGSVRVASGSVTITRENVAHGVQVGVAVREQDLIETGPDGEIGITFRDNSRISLGPGSRLAVSHIVFKPDRHEYGFIVQLMHGTIEYISGLTEKLAPDSVSIELPTSTIAVRGTRLLARAE